MKIVWPKRNDGGLDDYGISPLVIAKYGGMAIAIVIVAAVLFVWFQCRIDVAKGQFVLLMKKTGKDITNVMELAPDLDYKGPQFELLKEGRHFRNPWTWHWNAPQDATIIENGHVGILTRLYGDPITPDQVIAMKNNEKGILEMPLKPGRHYINTWAYDIKTVPMVRIAPGYVGIVTRRVGRKPKDSNVFVVNKGERGTQKQWLKPGTHVEFSNVYVYTVTPINTTSQKFEMAGKYGVTFPSLYGFDIKVEGTVEWAPEKDKLPELFVKYVDAEDLRASGGLNNFERKLILPFARSYFRTVGGQYRAVDFITGNTRIVVQKRVEEKLRESCRNEGIHIKSFVIRETKPPIDIRSQYERRELAMRQKDQFSKEIETAIGTPILGKDGKPVLDKNKQPMLDGGRLAMAIQERQKDRESKLGKVRQKIATNVRAAEQYRGVEVTKARRKLEVARIQLEAAKDRAAQVLAKGKAAAAVEVMGHKAEAEGVRAKIGAFGTGNRYAEYQLIMRLAPGIQKILSNTNGPFAKLFERFSAISSDSTNTTAPAGK